MEVEVAEDRLWRSSSSKFNTGGPVLKELLLAWRPKSRREGGGGKSVCGDPQGGSERGTGRGGEGEGVRAAAALHSAAGRHSVATLSHRLAGPPIERKIKGQKKRWRSSLLDPVEHEHVERFFLFFFQTPRLKISKLQCNSDIYFDIEGEDECVGVSPCHTHRQLSKFFFVFPFTLLPCLTSFLVPLT